MIPAAGIVYAVGGGLILYSGIKGATLADTAKAVLSGNLTLTTTQGITAKNSAPASTPASGGNPDVGKITSATASNMVKFALAQRGKPYSQNNPGRFGPNEWDCSGLIWACAHQAGLNMPGGPSNPAAAIVNPELQWLGAIPGAKVTTDKNSIEAGMVVGFTGSDASVHGTAKMNPDGTFNVGPAKNVPSCGHIGIAINATQFMSAYDTAEGCLVKPISDDFHVGVLV